MAKVLLFCPSYKKDGVLQMWPDAERAFHELKAPKGVKVTREIGLDNPFAGESLSREMRHKNTLHQYQKAQKRALDEGFDALCTYEHDMIVPEDGLIKLWETPAEVVYGVYLLRHGAYVVNAFQFMGETVNIGQSLSFYPDEYKKALETGQAEVSGCGFGFTLIRRSVLERFEMRAWEDNYAPDWALACDCQAAGVKQIARFDVKCGHIDDDRRILWVGKEITMTVKVRVLVHFVGDLGMGGQPFEPGDIVDAEPSKAWDFVRAGFIEYLDNPPKIKADPPIEMATIKPGEVSAPPRAKSKRKTPKTPLPPPPNSKSTNSGEE